MRMFDIIKKKRDGEALSGEEIRFFVSGYVAGEIPDYQASALCMAIYFRGMTNCEIQDLTFAVRDSGDKCDFSRVKGVRVDKHSTGGVGDKTSLVVAPIVAALGVKVAKMAGRGLGHTGGTIDKLEAIPGVKTEMDDEDFIQQVNDVGVAIVSQSADLTPADKKLYALRDVTATVDSLPLVVASIMGKKLASDDDCIVLDVKCGSGAFAKTLKDSKWLAKTMVEIGKNAGKKTMALITDMDRPLGRAIGNSLEVREAIATLNGHGPDDLTEICLILASQMLNLAGKGTLKECMAMAKGAIKDGSALKTLEKMVVAQGGKAEFIQNPDKLPKAKYTHQVLALESGYISKFNTEGVGVASLLLGAGRNTKEDKIDFAAGIVLAKTSGQRVKKGEVIATLYANKKSLFAAAEQKFLESVLISARKPKARPLVLAKII